MGACACKGHYYYRCARRTYVGDCVFDKYIREDEIEQYLLEHIISECHRYNVSAQKQSRKPKPDVAGIKRRIEKLKDLYLSDLILKEDYESEFIALRAALEDAQATTMPEVVQIDTDALTNALKSYHALDRTLKKELWGKMVSEIIAYADGTFSFTLRHTKRV
jgi:hypothetical protein